MSSRRPTKVSNYSIFVYSYVLDTLGYYVDKRMGKIHIAKLRGSPYMRDLRMYIYRLVDVELVQTTVAKLRVDICVRQPTCRGS